MYAITLTKGDFDGGDLDDSFSLRVGSETLCPNKIEFDAKNPELTVKADEVEINDLSCNGGQIDLTENLNTTVATLHLISIENDVGDFLAGNVSAEIACSSSLLKKGEQLIFIKPDDTLTINFSSLFGSVYRFGNDSDKYTFEEDDKYVILGDRCIYEETRISDRVCFTSDAMVTLENGMMKRMDNVRIGDMVQVNSNGKYEKVLGFSHSDSQIKAEFIKLRTDNDLSFTATPGHFIPVVDDKLEKSVKKMNDIEVGMKIEHVKYGWIDIVSVEKLKQTGVWNPHVKSGEIVVDDFIATCYTEVTWKAVVGHALLTPLRNEHLASILNPVWHLINHWYSSS